MNFVFLKDFCYFCFGQDRFGQKKQRERADDMQPRAQVGFEPMAAALHMCSTPQSRPTCGFAPVPGFPLLPPLCCWWNRSRGRFPAQRPPVASTVTHPAVVLGREGALSSQHQHQHSDWLILLRPGWGTQVSPGYMVSSSVEGLAGSVSSLVMDTVSWIFVYHPLYLLPSLFLAFHPPSLSFLCPSLPPPPDVDYCSPVQHPH